MIQWFILLQSFNNFNGFFQLGVNFFFLVFGADLDFRVRRQSLFADLFAVGGEPFSDGHF